MIIAIDGSAASGKGTLAKQLAKHFGLAYLDTGALYRAVALEMLNAGEEASALDEKQCFKYCVNLDLELTKSPSIRSEKVAELASLVAVIPAVRSQLLDLQRQFALQPPYGKGAILDGRDIGTVVLPNANIKFFIDADVKIRAERRTKELIQSGQSVMFRDVLSDMEERDGRDRSRASAPLVPADDAIVLDTSKLNAKAVLTLAKSYVSALSD